MRNNHQKIRSDSIYEFLNNFTFHIIEVFEYYLKLNLWKREISKYYNQFKSTKNWHQILVTILAKFNLADHCYIPICLRAKKFPMTDQFSFYFHERVLLLLFYFTALCLSVFKSLMTVPSLYSKISNHLMGSQMRSTLIINTVGLVEI